MEPASVVATDEIRSRVHGMWASVAGRWGEHADYVDARGAVVTARMLDLTNPRAGERVLELACGAGGAGLAAADRVGPGGEVVLSDVVAEMTSIAAARADVRASPMCARVCWTSSRSSSLTVRMTWCCAGRV